MELKWVEDFVTLASTLSFSRAADERHVTQPAFSRRIRQLEAWLGVTLVSRVSLPCELTPAGQRFLPVAQDMIRTLYNTREALRPTAEAGMVRFAALHTLTVTFFPEWLQRTSAQMRELRSCIIADRGGIEANLGALIDGEADFFLTYSHPDVSFMLDGDRFNFLEVGRDRVIPVAAPMVTVPGKRDLPGAGLVDRAVSGKFPVPFLSYGLSSFFGVALTRHFAERPRFHRRTMHENTISAGLKTVALTGAGICWLPKSLIESELASGQLVEAAAGAEWALDLEIRLYRASARGSIWVEKLWSIASEALSGAK